MATACTLVAPFFVVVWRSRELDDMKRVWGELERAVRKAGEPLVYVGVMTRTSKPATEAFRAKLGDFGELRARLCKSVYLVYEGDDASSIVERASVQTILREHHLKPTMVRSVAELLRVTPRAMRDDLRHALVTAGVTEPTT